MGSKLSTMWLDVVLIGAALVILVQGARIISRREVENPFVSARGGKAVLIGLVVVAVAVLAIVVAALDTARLRAR